MILSFLNLTLRGAVFLLALLPWLLCTSVSAQPDQRNYSNSDGDGLWLSGANWSGLGGSQWAGDFYEGSGPASNGLSSDLAFFGDLGAPQTVVLKATDTNSGVLGALSFNSTASYQIRANTPMSLRLGGLEVDTNTGDLISGNGDLILVVANNSNDDVYIGGEGSALQLIIDTPSGQGGIFVGESRSMRIDSQISGNGGIQKLGNGALGLFGLMNDYTGGNRVSGGILAGSSGTLRGDISIEYDGSTIEAPAVAFFEESGGSYDGNITLSEGVTGAFIAKSGGGTLTLGGTNSAGIATLIDQGTLIGNVNSLQGSVLINSDAVLEYFHPEIGPQSTGGYFGNVYGLVSSTFRKTGGGLLTAGWLDSNPYDLANSDFLGNLEVFEGGLQFAADSQIAASMVTVSGGATLIVDAQGLLVTNQVTVDSGGVLEINGQLGSVEQGTYVDSSGTLKGSGIIFGDVVVQGELNPGNSPGTFAVNGNLQLNPFSTINFELDETNQTTGQGINDLIDVAGHLTLGGILNVSFLPDQVFSGGFKTWTLFTYGNGFTDNGLSLGIMPSGTGWELDFGTPGEVRLNAVPEPSAVMLLCGVFAGTACLRRRRSG